MWLGRRVCWYFEQAQLIGTFSSLKVDPHQFANSRTVPIQLHSLQMSLLCVRDLMINSARGQKATRVVTELVRFLHVWSRFQYDIFGSSFLRVMVHLYNLIEAGVRTYFSSALLWRR